MSAAGTPCRASGHLRTPRKKPRNPISGIQSQRRTSQFERGKSVGLNSLPFSRSKTRRPGATRAAKRVEGLGQPTRGGLLPLGSPRFRDSAAPVPRVGELFVSRARLASVHTAPSRYTGLVTQISTSPAPESSSGGRKILALDYGRTKIGLALAGCEARVAEPHDTLERVNRNEDIRRLRTFVRDHGVRQIVVGLPLRLDGSRGDMADEATRFAERLRKQIGIPVELVDERLTSWEAERLLEEELGRRIAHRDTGHGRKKISRAGDGKYTVDAVAAMVILREYLARTPTLKERP